MPSKRIKPRKRSKTPLMLAVVFLGMLGLVGFAAHQAWQMNRKPAETKPVVAEKPKTPHKIYVDEKGHRIEAPPEAEPTQADASETPAPVARTTESQPPGAAFGVYGVRSKDHDADAAPSPSPTPAPAQAAEAPPPTPAPRQPPATQPAKDKPVVTFFGVEGR